MAQNYIVEIDVVRVDGTTREAQTLRFMALRVSPILLTNPHPARIDVSGLPTLTSEIQAIFYGRSRRSLGAIQINNSDGEYNCLLTNGWALENRPCRILQGDSADAQAAYTALIDGKTGNVEWTSEYISFEYNDGTLDLSTIPHVDKTGATSSISDAIDAIVDAASVDTDASVASWLSTYGSKNVYLDFNGQTLQGALDEIVTPLRSYYGFNKDGELFIKLFEIPLPTGTPVATLTERDVLTGFTRASLNRLVWRIQGQWFNSGTATEVFAHSGIDVNGAAVSVDSGNKTGVPATAHGYQVGDNVRIYDDETYQGEYAVQSETTTDQVVINKAYVSHTFTDAIIRNTTEYPFAQDKYNVGGLFTSESDAQDAANDWLELFGVPRYRYTVQTKRQRVDASLLELGEHIRLVLPQPYGTVDAAITKLSNDISTNTITIEAVA